MANQTAKRCAALALCLALSLSFLPAPALAAALPEKAVSQAETKEEPAAEVSPEAEEAEAEEESSAAGTDPADTGDADSSASQSAPEEVPTEAAPTDESEAVFSGETLTSEAEGSEAERLETKWIEVDDPTEVTDFIWDNWSGSCFSQAVVDPDQNRVTVDGEQTAVEDAFGEAAKEADILESASAAEEYFDGTTYEAERQSDGTVTVTAPYQTCRVVVNASALTEDYGAETILHYGDYDEYILQFSDEESTQAAYEKISAQYEGDCYLDEVLLAEDVLAEDTSDTSASYTAWSWGADYMGMTELKNSAAVSGTVTVAILDSGCDVDNWFFEGRTFSELSYDFPNETAGIDSMTDSAGDTTGHGTHVAGIITDCTPENAELMILRVFDDEGKCTQSMALNALRYAVEQGADVINVSLGSYTFKDATVEAWDDVLAAAADTGVVVVCAAGNDNGSYDYEVTYPASSAYTVAVSNITKEGTLSSSSCYGETIDFCAPGDKIVSAKNGGSDGETTKMSGTSMAAPHVTAAFAWLKLLNPDASSAELYELAKESAVDLGDAGKDDQYGWGCLYLGSGEETALTCTLSKTSYTYTGSACTPAVTVQRGEETLPEEDYTLTYADNVEPGTASVTVTLAADTAVTKTLHFTIRKRQPIVSVSLAKTTLCVGETARLSVSTRSEGELFYDTDDCEVADVDENGLVTAVGPGTVTITVTADESDHDEEVYGSVKVTVKLAAPKLTLTNGAKGVTVKWGKIAGADSYDLYRRTGSGSWTKLKSTSVLSYTDKSAANGKQYSYKVVARDSVTGASSAASSARTICRLRQCAITQLKNKKKKTLCVRWKQNSAASGYQVQYAAESNFSGGKTLTITGKKKCCKKLTGLKKGKRYYVRVRSWRKVNGKKVYSAWSEVCSQKVAK